MKTKDARRLFLVIAAVITSCIYKCRAQEPILIPSGTVNEYKKIQLKNQLLIIQGDSDITIHFLSGRGVIAFDKSVKYSKPPVVRISNCDDIKGSIYLSTEILYKVKNCELGDIVNLCIEEN